VRDILFAISVLFSLTTSNHKLFWLLIDNIYSIRSSCNIKKPQPHKYYYIICRFKRARDPSLSQGSRASTSKRVAKAYDFSFVLLEFPNHIEYRPISQQDHDYLLDESNANKRNSFLLGLVQKDITRSFAPAIIISSLRPAGRLDIYAKLDSVGGRYLSRRDIINNSTSWRLVNPNVLLVSRDSRDDVSV
jgi:hypothetical protein